MCSDTDRMQARRNRRARSEWLCRIVAKSDDSRSRNARKMPRMQLPQSESRVAVAGTRGVDASGQACTCRQADRQAG